MGRLGIDWFPGIEVSSLALIETYVDSGYGIGLSVAFPIQAVDQNPRDPLGRFYPRDPRRALAGEVDAAHPGVLGGLQRRAQSLTN